MLNQLLLTQTQHLWLFGLMVLGIIALPGMDMAYVLASAVTGGRRQGLAAVAGIVVGGVVHVAMAMLGLGLLLQLYPAAFNTLLAAGSLYIAWIGWTVWRAAAALGEVGAVPCLSGAQAFRRGVMSCLMNPKAYVFMVAVFPQFVRTEYGSLAAQALVMGVIIAVTQIGVYGALAWGAGSVRQWLRDNPRSQVVIARAVGLLLMVAALWTLWQGWRWQV